MTVSLITGGSGFVGINLAHRLISDGGTVYVFDNLSRSNVARNLSWLTHLHSRHAIVEIEDIRDQAALRRVVSHVDQVFHFAAQVAVASSIEHPRTDFDVNVVGTLNLLEELRMVPNPPRLIYTSTNKVYGSLDHIPLGIEGKRYRRTDNCDRGIDETMQLDFQSPYACSKGAAEQYVLDYQRTFGLRTAVFRMSCIYGPHQFGTAEQGWVAHMISRAILGRPVTIYGNGCQVRDLLFIDDLVDAFLLAQQCIDTISGQAFNIGGGPENTLSLLELTDLLQEFGTTPKVTFSPWRQGDQKYYVSDTRKFGSLTGWAPRVGPKQGVRAVHDWLQETYRAEPETALREAS